MAANYERKLEHSRFLGRGPIVRVLVAALVVIPAVMFFWLLGVLKYRLAGETSIYLSIELLLLVGRTLIICLVLFRFCTAWQVAICHRFPCSSGVQGSSEGQLERQRGRHRWLSILIPQL